MNKILLTALVLFFTTGLIKAQDVYYAGYGSASDTTAKAIKVWQNNNLLYQISVPQVDAYLKAMESAPNDQYLGGYVVESNGTHHARIWHNSTLLLEGSQGSEVRDIAVVGDTVFAAGYITIDSGATSAAIWRNDSLIHTLYDTASATIANAIYLLGDHIIAAGYREDVSGYRTALIWQNDSILYTLGNNGSHAEISAITCSEGLIYSAGSIFDSTGTGHAAVWCNDSLLYQLSGSASAANAILIEQGQIYVGGSVTGEAKIWKDGTIIESMGSETASVNTLSINDFGLFSAGKSDGNGKVWCNGEVLYSPCETEEIPGLCVIASCNGITRTLPWSESFEPYDTDWPCWMQLDADSANNGQNGFWERSNDLANNGAWSARHLKGDSLQEGWLISPKIYLQPGRDSTYLSFNTLELRPASHGYSGLWISTTSSDTTSFEEVWSQNDPSGNWKTASLDLRTYQGQAIYLGFKYEGKNAHDWYIDNIVMDETYAMRDTVQTFPYLDCFDNGLNDWYVIDEDHSGGQINWKTGMYADSSLYAIHPASDTTLGPQKGWLISRPIKLMQDKLYHLSFATKANDTLATGKNSLWIGTDVENLPPANDFSKIWEDEAPGLEWKNVDIDLSSNSGQTLYLAFKYEGENAHEFLLDSIGVTEYETEYTITVAPNNEAWGVTTGSGTYPTFDTVQISATALEGYEFRNWDDGNTDNPRNIIVTQNQTYTAEFGLIRYTITTEVLPADAGTVTGGGLYEVGSSVSLEAIANSGFSFANWSDGNTDNPREIIVNGDATYTAVFESHQYTITTVADPVEGGTVTGGGSYNYGDTAILSPIPNENYIFLCWSDGIVSNPRNIIVTENATYTALFHLSGGPNYTVTVTSLNPELGRTTGSGVYPAGTEIEISAIPNENAYFESWDDGNTDNPRHVVVNSNLVFRAKFGAINTFNITVVPFDPTMGTTYGSGIYQEGQSVNIGATPYSDFIFDHWDDGNTDNPRHIVVTDDKTYTAYFTDKPITTYTVTVYYNDEQGVVIGGGTYPKGATARLAAIPKEGFVFFNWNDGNTDNPREIIVNNNMEFIAFFQGNDINENPSAKLSLFPNPVNDILHIDGLEDSREIMIYDALGHKVRKEKADDNGNINVSSLPSGLYLIQSEYGCCRFLKK